MKNFTVDNDTKDILNDIAKLFGVKQDVVKEVWEMTLFCWFLKMSENPEQAQEITIPYLGKVALKFESEELDNAAGKIKTNVSTNLKLSDDFTDMFGNIYNVGETGLAEIVQNKIRKTLDKY